MVPRARRMICLWKVFSVVQVPFFVLCLLGVGHGTPRSAEPLADLSTGERGVRGDDLGTLGLAEEHVRAGVTSLGLFHPTPRFVDGVEHPTTHRSKPGEVHDPLVAFPENVREDNFVEKSGDVIERVERHGVDVCARRCVEVVAFSGSRKR